MSSEPEYKTCPSCKEKDISISARQCKHCSYDFTSFGYLKRYGAIAAALLGLVAIIQFLSSNHRAYLDYLDTVNSSKQVELDIARMKTGNKNLEQEKQLIIKERELVLKQFSLDSTKDSLKIKKEELVSKQRETEELQIDLKEKERRLKKNQAQLMIYEKELQIQDSILQIQVEVNNELTEKYNSLAISGDQVKTYEVPSFVEYKVNDLPWHPTRRWGIRALRVIDNIIVHQELGEGNTEQINAYHIKPNHISSKGAPHIIYHYTIEKDGRIIQTNDLTAITWHTKGYNATGIGISVLGNFSGKNYSLGTSEPTDEQIESLNKLLDYLKSQLDLKEGQVFGHNDISNKSACPGFILEEVLKKRKSEDP